MSGLLQAPMPQPVPLPRRRTLCTEDAREIVPPQLPFFDPTQLPSRSSTSRRSPKPAGSMSIDVQLADRSHNIRPLPRIPIPPTPKSAPPAPGQQLSRTPSLRPLPSLPESGALAISVTPATPLPPPTPTVVESSTHLAPPARQGPPRFTSLSLKLQTSPDALKPRDFPRSLPSPPSPLIPQPLSPGTAHRNRVSKLRRHLGESVQMQLAQIHLTPDRSGKFDVLAEWKEEDNTVAKVLDLDGTDSDPSSDGDSDDTGDYSWGMARAPSTRVSPPKKWIRERGKERWTEDNFSKILNDLRAL
ncbi:hypothetical protein FB451DRAFT_1203021 [Mycena latifolia]|nr:hypothetical protein FB451DRAFT_1203021 [Mycena latifolia]